MIGWAEFRAAEPQLASFVEDRLNRPPAYLATVRADGSPRVHPVTPIVADVGLFVFMEPTSPKGIDLSHRGFYAMHNGVPDSAGTGGEVLVSGVGRPVTDSGVRQMAVDAASYAPADRYVLFELMVDEVRALSYGDVPLPQPSRWRIESPSGPA